MAYTNYTDLQALVASYLGRSDLATIIPDFIRFAETRLSRELRTRQMLKSSTASLTGGDPRIAVPGDFLQIRDLFTFATYMATIGIPVWDNQTLAITP